MMLRIRRFNSVLKYSRRYSNAEKPLEIEMKFRLDAETKRRIQSLPNINFLSSQVFKDVYYDSVDHKITGRDVWLRKRIKSDKETWQMKVPINFQSIRSKDTISRPKTDQYYEMESKTDISQFLQEERLVARRDAKVLSLDELEAQKFVAPFAAFDTSRTKYQFEDIIVDLDEADFGYSIGELEIVVPSAKEAADAETRIRGLARRLNLDMVGVVRGKLIEFIYRNDPAHYDALKRAGVLRQEQ